jgi:hypothetical protein
MHRFLFLLLLAGSLGAALGGCAISEEDKDFYYRGWLRPTDLDREPPSRLRKKSPADGPPIQYKKDPLIDM